MGLKGKFKHFWIDFKLKRFNIFFFFSLFAGIYPRVTMISTGGFIFFGIYEETKKLMLKFF